MPDIKQITLPNGNTYAIKDAQARNDIEDIKAAIAGGLTFFGETTTALTDGSTTNPITINGQSVTAKSGNLVLYSSKEFLFDGTKWIEMGDLSLLGALAYKNSASGSFTPSGDVSKPTFTGQESEVSITATTPSSGKGNYTPEGTISAPSIALKTAGTETVIYPVKTVGALPNLSTTVANETLTIGWSAGSLPTLDAKINVKTGDGEYEASAPVFTGAGKNISGTVTPLGDVSKPTFTGTSGTVTVQ